MSAISIASSDRSAAGQQPAQDVVRVAVVSDYLEEHWPSMDLVADMVAAGLQAQPETATAATQLRPRMNQRVSRIPILGRHRSALNADRLLNRFVEYPRWLGRRAKNFDIFHLVDHSYSQLLHVLPPGRTVVTCHDLDTFRCLLEPQREPRSRAFRAMTRRILEGFQKAAHVIAVSEATREELLRHRLFPASAITVVANGVHPSCCLSPDAEADALAARWMPARSPADGRPLFWLLNVGNTMARKRLDVLLRVFAAVHRQRPQARLMRVGGFTPAHTELMRELKIDGAVTTLPFLERSALAAVYRRATLLAHTSEAEGFGLPLIEAMACGCPVAASDIPVLREVGGLAVSFAPVADTEAWSQLLLQLIDERQTQPDQWEGRRKRSLTRAACFSWAENARQTADIYREVMKKHEFNGDHLTSS